MAETIKLTERTDVRELVKEKYGAAALTVLNGQGAACCGGNTGGGSSCCDGDTITGGLYDETEVALIPEAALLASLGCGNPTALAQLNPGEIVLDLGSGGGIDVLLSAKRVGPTGFVYGLDMTDAMLALAEQNRAAAGADNVRFLKGHIEEIPLPDASVDVIISNCVINLSSDKSAVLREAFRILKPGGRFAVSDVVVDGILPPSVRTDMEAFVGCVAGALEKSDYLARLAAVGFVEAAIEPTRRYAFADLEATTCCSPETKALPTEEKAALDGRIMGAFIRAQKPTAACCGPDCCASSTHMSTQTIALVAGTDSDPHSPVKLSAFRALLGAHREKQFQLLLPNANAVPVCFHITEVAHVRKRFIDCGGRLHTNDTCQLQAWVWTDTEHRLLAGKMADILRLSEKVLPEDQDLDVEIEYEDRTISQYPVTGYTVSADAVTLTLGYKHTDCLAKDVCLPQANAAGDAGCCGSACNCG